MHLPVKAYPLFNPPILIVIKLCYNVGIKTKKDCEAGRSQTKHRKIKNDAITYER